MIRNWICATVACLGIFAPTDTKADDISLAIKSGETIELFRTFWIAPSTCETILKSTPIVETLAGPSNLTVSISKATVTPRGYDCKKTPGGIVSLTAKDIAEVENVQLIIRLKLDTLDGERVRSYTYDVVMVP